MKKVDRTRLKKQAGTGPSWRISTAQKWQKASKCQSNLFFNTKNFSFKKPSQCQKKLKGGLFGWDFSTWILLQSTKKRDRLKKKLLRKKGGPLGFFQHLCWGRPFGRKKFKKSHNAERTWNVPLVPLGIVLLSEKEEKLFWFSSLGQMIQFGTIKHVELLGTILVSSCGLKKKSHYNSRASLHEALTNNKPGTAKVCAISKAQNCKRGILWASRNFNWLHGIGKIEGGRTLERFLKFSEKDLKSYIWTVSQCRKR